MTEILHLSRDTTLRVVPSHTNSASPSTTTSSEILLWDRKKQIRFWELRQNHSQLLSLGASVEFHDCITGQIAGRFAERKIRPETNRLFFVCLSPLQLSHRIRCFGNISFHNFYIFMVISALCGVTIGAPHKERKKLMTESNLVSRKN